MKTRQERRDERRRNSRKMKVDGKNTATVYRNAIKKRGA